MGAPTAPVTLPPGQLHTALGVRDIHHVVGATRLAVTERALP